MSAQCCPTCGGANIQFQKVLHGPTYSGECWFCKDCDSQFVTNYRDKPRRLGGDAPDASGKVRIDKRW